MSAATAAVTISCNFKIYHDVAIDSLHIWAGNDITISFRSAANRINVFIWGHVRVRSRFPDNGSIDFKNVYSLQMLIQQLYYPLCNLLDMCVLLDHEIGSRMDGAHRHLRVT